MPNIYTHAARNTNSGIEVKWNLSDLMNQKFVITGDSRKVKDKTLLALFANQFPSGWVKAPATDEEMRVALMAEMSAA